MTYGIEVKDKIADLYRQGKTVKEIVAACGVSRQTVERVVKSRDLQPQVAPENMLTFNEIQERLPIGRAILWRLVNEITFPYERRGYGGAHYYPADIVQRIRASKEYKRTISHRNHKKRLRVNSQYREIDKDIMRCVTCRFLVPEYDPAQKDYACVNFRTGGREIKNLSNTCGCWMWVYGEDNDAKAST